MNESEVVAVRAADAAACEQVAFARQGVRAAESASSYIKQDLLDAEGPARRAAEAAEKQRRMDWVEHAYPNLLVDLEAAQERLAEVSRYEVPDGGTPAVGGQAHRARERAVELEAEVDRRLAEAPDDVVSPAMHARKTR